MVSTGLREPLFHDMVARKAFVASITALALHSGGMTLCEREIMWLGMHLAFMSPLRKDDPLHDAWLAAQGVVEARRRADDPAFEDSRHMLRCALASYWAGRAAALGGVT